MTRASDRPVLWPDRPWEGSCAMPFSGGLWKTAHGWRCWYLADFRRVCVAASDDGLTWEKPQWGIVPGSNIVLEPKTAIDTVCVWPRPDGGYAMTLSTPNGGPVSVLTSPDGLRWAEAGILPHAGDRTTFFWNHVAGRWVFAVRAGGGTDGDPRRIDRVVSETVTPTDWQPERWLSAELPQPAQLYGFDVAPDGDRLVGLFTVYNGQTDRRPKLNNVHLGFSTDGETFQRFPHPVATWSDAGGAWNRGNVQAVAGGVVRVADGYRIYASGRAGEPGSGKNGICSLGYVEAVL